MSGWDRVKMNAVELTEEDVDELGAPMCGQCDYEFVGGDIALISFDQYMQPEPEYAGAVRTRLYCSSQCAEDRNLLLNQWRAARDLLERFNVGETIPAEKLRDALYKED